MKMVISFIIGVLLTLLLVYANIPGLDRFVGYREAIKPVGSDVVYDAGNEVTPDTVQAVVRLVGNPKHLEKIDSLQNEIVRLYRLKQMIKHDTLWRDTTIYLPDTTKYIVDHFVSTKTFNYPYADFTVSALSPLPVDKFRDDKAVFYFNKYLKDNHYVKNPKVYFGLTEFEWKLLAGGIGIGAVGWEIVR